MIWNSFSELKNKHAKYSPSNYSWTNYTEEKFVENYKNSFSKDIGTILHEWVSTLINNKMKLRPVDIRWMILELKKHNNIPIFAYEDDTKRLYNNIIGYVNDCVDCKMDSEITLYYSEWFFGTTDAINYDSKEQTLHIFDLKTGKGKTSLEQVRTYAALFCLQYKVEPEEIIFDLRIYQNSEIIQDEEDDLQNLIRQRMDLIIRFDILANEIGGR